VLIEIGSHLTLFMHFANLKPLPFILFDSTLEVGAYSWICRWVLRLLAPNAYGRASNFIINMIPDFPAQMALRIWRHDCSVGAAFERWYTWVWLVVR